MIDSIDSPHYNLSQLSQFRKLLMRYPDQESSTVEFKKTLPNRNQIIHTVIAFCNLFGGRIIIGVDDYGEIVGVPEEKINQTIESLAQSIYQSCTPPILPAIYTQRFEEKIVIIVDISSGMSKPYFETKAGLAHGTYIRVGSMTAQANLDVIDALRWQSRGYSFDEMPVYQALLSDLDETAFIQFLKSRAIGYRKNQAITPLLFQYKLIFEENQRIYPSVAGILLFGKKPQQFFSEAFIICSRFQGRQGRNIIASKDCEGTLFQQIEDAFAFIVNHLNKSLQIKSIKRKEKLEIPEEAIREILVNAVAHRAYQNPSPIKIAIYDDRIEFFSPGNFPGPLNVNSLESGITYIRNQVICKLFREAGYIEKLGSGFITTFESYRKNHLATPTVIEGSGFIKCILPRASYQKLIVCEEDSASKLHHLFETRPEVRIKDVTTTLAVSRQTATRLLSNLTKKKKIIKLGKGPNTRYIPIVLEDAGYKTR